MKVNIYIEQKDFDKFFVWLNHIKQGAIESAPVDIQTTNENIKDPLMISLNPDEYYLIKDTESNIDNIRNIWGNLDVFYNTQPLEVDKIMINDIIKNAERWEVTADLITTALEIAMALPGITPLEAMIIAERQWLNDKKTPERAII
jgi:hypothetical protein